MTFTLAHISDPHLGPLPPPSKTELISKRIFGYINWKRNRHKQLDFNVVETMLAQLKSCGYDHLAITGDLVNLATNAEIDRARDWLLQIDPPERLSLIPGNHDAYVPGALAKTMQRWQPFMSGDDAKTGFPFLRIRGKIALIGCSSAIATPPFSANGFFSQHQRHATQKMLTEAEKMGLFRVIMIHHPPFRGATSAYKRLLGIARFEHMLKLAGAELILHGHTHLDTQTSLHGKDGPVPIYGVASASQGKNDKKPSAAFNLFKIDGEPGHWTLKHEHHPI